MSGIEGDVSRAIDREVVGHEVDAAVSRATEVYETKEAAEKRAEEIGCSGAHKMPDGWMPCSSHAEYERTQTYSALAEPGAVDDREYRIIMPKTDNSGQPLRPKLVEDFAKTVSERFGGVTIFPSVAGCFIPDEGEMSGELICEENVVITTVRDSEDDVTNQEDEQWLTEFAEVVARDLGQLSVLTSVDVIEAEFVEGEFQESLPSDQVGRDVFRELF